MAEKSHVIAAKFQPGERASLARAEIRHEITDSWIVVSSFFRPMSVV